MSEVINAKAVREWDDATLQSVFYWLRVRRPEDAKARKVCEAEINKRYDLAARVPNSFTRVL